jgi:hypothetical protein
VPVDIVGGTAGQSGASIVAPSVLYPRFDEDLLLSFYLASAANAITVPGSQTSVTGATGDTRSIVAGYETITTLAATGTRTATVASGAVCAWNICIRPPQTGDISIWGASTSSMFPVKDSPAPVIGRGGVGAIDRTLTGFSGQYKVPGYTERVGSLAPLYRTVRLLTMNGTVVRGAMSVESDGSFVFTEIPAGQYIVLGIDQNLVDNETVIGLFAAVPM